jgi:hypothetical protein
VRGGHWLAHSSRGKKVSCRHPPLRSGPAGASSIACGLSIAIETAMVAGSDSQGVHDMSTIGTFKKIGEGEFIGDINTLRLRLTGVHIVSVTRTNDNAPSHRVLFGRIDYAERVIMRSGMARAAQFGGFRRDGALHNREA